jgi:UDP-N-acetyl-D-glucosamine dehydrogenase
MPEDMVATPPAAQLEEKLRTLTATVAVVGLGYVGLPLLRAFFSEGYPVIGFDVDQEKIDLLSNGQSHLKHLGAVFAQEMCKSEKFHVTAEAEKLRMADVIILCVPTTLGRHGEPDMSYITQSTEMVAKVLRNGRPPTNQRYVSASLVIPKVAEA